MSSGRRHPAILSFTADSPVSAHAKSTFDQPQEAQTSGVCLSPSLPSSRSWVSFYLCPACPQLLAPVLSQKALSVFAFDGLWGWENFRSFGLSCMVQGAQTSCTKGRAWTETTKPRSVVIRVTRKVRGGRWWWTETWQVENTQYSA